ncbi:MAG TPA: hypothetical protein VFX09_04655 [Burkholderiales bacterium]|jgi:hypothetical protein|nr:hypothetical protein [Burkholderiales bacterium]
MKIDPPVEEPRDPHLGRPFAQMTSGQKVAFVLKVIACVATLGMAFPNVMSD